MTSQEEKNQRAAKRPGKRLWAARFFVFVLAAMTASWFGLKVYSHKKLQEPLDNILEEAGIGQLQVSARYERLLKRDNVIFDVRAFGKPGAGALLRSFYEFASTQQNEMYNEVKIAYRGRVVLKIDGGTFQELGGRFGNTDMDSLNRRFALSAQLPGGRRVVELDHQFLARLLNAAKRARGR